VHEPAVNSDQLTGLCAAALEAIPRPVVVSDHETILFANAAAARQLGAKTSAELIGLSISELLHPDCHDTAAERRRLLEESGHELHGLPSKVVGRDGSIISTVTDAHSIEFGGEVAFIYTGGLAVAWAGRS
jgi:PAS domain S-box-containing protein